MGIYTKLVRPLLFTLTPERAQKLAEAALRIRPLWKAAAPLLVADDERLHCDIGGIELPNPVGLAAGYDKDGRLVDHLASLGFGYIVIGTVVVEPREGNPSPRLARDTATRSLVNSLGFPSQGLERVLQNISRVRTRKVPVLASISGLTVEEFSRCYRAVQPVVSGVELNISSPNTEGIRVFQEPEKLEELFAALHPLKEKPLYLKLPPYFDDAQRSRIMDLVDLCLRYSVEGVTAVNTRLVEDGRLAMGKGGLSGGPLYPHMLRNVKEIREHAGLGLTINACGGISSGEDALQALIAGANTVQVFTGLIYQGPAMMMGINRHLTRFMAKEGIASIKEVSAAPLPD